MSGRKLRRLLLCLTLLGLLSGCGGAGEGLSGAPIGSMALRYAEEFSVDYYPGDLALVTIGEDRFLVVPPEARVPDTDLPVIRQGAGNIYLASSSAMDLFLRAEALDQVTMTSTGAESWSIPRVRQAVEEEDILFVGRYSAPDYEVILDEGCALAVENTMIYHCPAVKEQLERLGIPVLVERSSYERHPLGRVEWIKLYGLLTGKLDQAEAFFASSEQRLAKVAENPDTGKTVAIFYLTASGSANVRRPGDYMVRMVELAGGTYIFSDLETEDSMAPVNMELEAFYAGARDADVLIYNSTVAGEVSTLEALLEQCPMLADFRAVQTGSVWCTRQNMFQQTGAAADMIVDLSKALSGAEEELGYLYRLQ